MIWRILKKINGFLDANWLLAYLLLFLICFMYFFWLQYSPTLADPDSFYHIKIAQMMGEQGLFHTFPYLKFTAINANFADHHYLYHLLMVPFVTWLPPFVGAKLFHIILDSFLILTIFWLLKKFRVSGAFFYSLLLLFCEAFIFRMSLIKAQPLAMILSLLAIYLIVRRKYLWLALLSFVYVWSYGGWILVLIMAGLFVLVDAVFGRKKGERFFKKLLGGENFKLIGGVVGGLALGLVLNPFFPHNLIFYWMQTVQIALVNYQDKIGVGAEWYPYNFKQFLENNFLISLLLIPATVLFLNYFKKLGVVVKFLFVLVIMFVVATIKSRRNIEYLIPFSVIFSAVVFSSMGYIDIAKKELRHFAGLFRKYVFGLKFIRQFLFLVVVIAIIYLGYNLPMKSKRNLSNGLNYSYLEDGSKFLADNSEFGDVVINSDWDEFPMLFFHNSRNFYIVGLDPTFMYLYDAELYQRWADVTVGKRYSEMYKIAKEELGAKFVIVVREHEAFIDNLDMNFYFAEVYRDKEVVIYKVL